MHLDSLLVPALRARVNRVVAGIASPRPSDEPRAAASGPDALRILVLGAGPTKSWGVRSHALALPGQLARSLAQRTGRGAAVDLVVAEELPTSPGTTPRAVGFGRYDAVVLTLGLSDALQPGHLDGLRARLSWAVANTRSSNATMPVVIAGVTPTNLLAELSPMLHRAAARFAGRLDAEAAALAERSEGVTFVPLRVPAMPPRNGTCAEIYAGWACDLAEALAALVGGRERESSRPVARLHQEASADLGLVAALRAAPSTELDRLLGVARSSFGVSTSSITLLDDESAYFRMNSKEPELVVPRKDTMCTHTAKERGALVVEDLSEDPRFQDSPVHTRHGFRFYAGYPLEAEDGRRLGALCILDEHPHPVSDVDVSLLRDIALLAQRELVTMARDADAVTAAKLRRA